MHDEGQDVIRAAIDLPTEGATVARGLVHVTGWALADGGPLERALLVVDGAPTSPLRIGAWRPDVAEALPDLPHAGASGFDTTFDLRAQEPGQVRIALLAAGPGEPLREVCSRTVTAAGPPRERDGARSRAVFTIANDEPLMLPLWLNYYSRFFDPPDIFVLAHNAAPDALQALAGRCTVVPVHRQAAFDHVWLRAVVEDFQAFLLRSYETVLFAEADEFVVADPRHHAGLDAYIEQMRGPAARCCGFNVVHQPDEAALRLDAPLLSQRRWWHASQPYSKRLLSRIPLRWSQGFHAEYRAPDAAPDPELLLVHLHRVDYDRCLDRHRRAAARDWSEADAASGAGIQNRIVDPQAFDEWFRRGPDLDAPPELIPNHIREIL